MKRKASIKYKWSIPILTTPKVTYVKSIFTKDLKPNWNQCEECTEKGCFLCDTDHSHVKEILKGYYGNNKEELNECILYNPILLVYRSAMRYTSKDFKSRQEFSFVIREKVRKEIVIIYRQYVREGYWDTMWFLSGRCPRCEDPTAVQGKCNIPHGVRENARCIYSYGIDPALFIDSYGNHNKMFYGFILIIKRK